jgi:hypothetical protein
MRIRHLADRSNFRLVLRSMVFPSVTLPPSASAATSIDPAKTDEAVRLFREFGAVRLVNVFSSSFQEDIRKHYQSRYRTELEATRQADHRPLFTVKIEGPIATPTYLVNPLIEPIVARLLGDDFVIGAVSTVISFPGAPQQFVHRDSPSLSGDYEVDAKLPPYALTTLIPLVDANEETGSTRVWLGSHHQGDPEKGQTLPSDSPNVDFGSLLMTDSRVLHCGSPNVSSKVRPLLYNTYHRNWFRDYSGYSRRQSVSISRRVRSRLAPSLAARFRIADESAGAPEGPTALPGIIQNAAPMTIRRVLAGFQNRSDS